MGTRSAIGVMHGDRCKAVYAHWDGYLEHNGRILQEHYDSVKANNLVALGNVSSLGKDIGTKHDFSRLDSAIPEAEYEALYGDMTTFYGRDRGEEGCEFNSFDDFGAFFDYYESSWCEYYYVMKDGVWYYGTFYEGTASYKQLLPLAEAIATIQEKEAA